MAANLREQARGHNDTFAISYRSVAYRSNAIHKHCVIPTKHERDKRRSPRRDVTYPDLIQIHCNWSVRRLYFNTPLLACSLSPVYAARHEFVALRNGQLPNTAPPRWIGRILVERHLDVSVCRAQLERALECTVHAHIRHRIRRPRAHVELCVERRLGETQAQRPIGRLRGDAVIAACKGGRLGYEMNAGGNRTRTNDQRVIGKGRRRDSYSLVVFMVTAVLLPLASSW